MDDATEKFLDNDKSPSRKVNELDTRGSHFYLALYWAEALANQNKDLELKEQFTKVDALLKQKESNIVQELIDAQDKSMDIGGYYLPNQEKVAKAMRPSNSFNEILDNIDR